MIKQQHSSTTSQQQQSFDDVTLKFAFDEASNSFSRMSNWLEKPIYYKHYFPVVYKRSIRALTQI